MEWAAAKLSSSLPCKRAAAARIVPRLDMEQLLMEVVQGGLLPLGIGVDCPSQTVCWRDSRVMQDSGEPAAFRDVLCAGCSRHCSMWLCWQCPCSTAAYSTSRNPPWQLCRQGCSAVAPLHLSVKQHAMPLQAPTCLRM